MDRFDSVMPVDVACTGSSERFKAYKDGSKFTAVASTLKHSIPTMRGLFPQLFNISVTFVFNDSGETRKRLKA